MSYVLSEVVIVIHFQERNSCDGRPSVRARQNLYFTVVVSIFCKCGELVLVKCDLNSDLTTETHLPIMKKITSDEYCAAGSLRLLRCQNNVDAIPSGFLHYLMSTKTRQNMDFDKPRTLTGGLRFS